MSESCPRHDPTNPHCRYDPDNWSADSATDFCTCEHDWRIDPHVVLTSNPPQRLLVCARCGQQKASGISNLRLTPSRDPKEWERWTDA